MTIDLQQRLKKVKLLALDVDGVLTDGKIFWIEGQGWTRQFYIQDGYGIKLLMKQGLQIAVISGGDSKDVRLRMEFLKIEKVFLGSEDKLIALQKIIQDTGLALDEIAFVGDELFDIPVLTQVGFSATVPHAVAAVKKCVHYVTQAMGGAGAVREVADLILQAQGL